MTLTVENTATDVQVGTFVKNLSNEKAVTDFYLTDDSSGLFRNVFYTEPRTYGVFVQKRF
jgi:hypothetical protein